MQGRGTELKKGEDGRVKCEVADYTLEASVRSGASDLAAQS